MVGFKFDIDTSIYYYLTTGHGRNGHIVHGGTYDSDTMLIYATSDRTFPSPSPSACDAVPPLLVHTMLSRNNMQLRMR
jgi:hypothetical protein